MDWSELLKNPVGVALVTILILVSLLYAAFKAEFVTFPSRKDPDKEYIQNPVFTEAWIQRVERNLVKQHDLASAVTTLGLQVERLERDLKEHLTEANPLIQEFQSLKTEVDGVTQTLRDQEERWEKSRDELKDLLDKTIGKIDEFKDRVLERGLGARSRDRQD